MVFVFDAEENDLSESHDWIELKTENLTAESDRRLMEMYLKRKPQPKPQPCRLAERLVKKPDDFEEIQRKYDKMTKNTGALKTLG